MGRGKGGEVDWRERLYSSEKTHTHIKTYIHTYIHIYIHTYTPILHTNIRVFVHARVHILEQEIKIN